MFDFFKDMYYEMHGFNMKKLKEEQAKKKEQENLFFDMKLKIIFCAIGALLSLCYLAAFLFAAANGYVDIVVKSLLLVLVIVATMICVVINNKKVQLIGVAGMVIVMILTMLI
ncbi:MAG: hypothetical protein K2H41_15460 [Acetatifactor sp.]|nr:hypothetical protein [Acetatifactor sp.]